ncbi:putative ubiquitin-protein ligase E3 [Rhizoctonia solani 123E]|uniref:RBR-type E3 ubiquitin transferase n=1 Tax=Rhizoctonia solani 123E TaxID=1423351 RepID=A0A074RUM5_9AGAM|nr:putative ubiquitin-protein ligase E3 [Rhizoctonia solani 123E]
MMASLEFEQLQEEEIDALVAVYPDILTQNSVAAGKEIKLGISIELETERKFDIVSSSVVDTSSPGAEHNHSSQLHTSGSVPTTLMHLPPLLINIVLPPTYPQTKPVIQSISARYTWLAPALLRKLAARLDEMWTPGDSVLWQWVEDVRAGAFLESALLPHPSPNILLSHLVIHQANTKQAQFSAQTFKCGICLSVQRGVKCIQLDCPNADVFCLECLKEFWGMCVSEGEVTKVACPGIECVEAREKAKNDSGDVGDVGDDVIGRVLNKEQVTRWKRLRVKHLAEKDPSAVPCPVRRCQAPVPRPKAAEDNDAWAQLRTCDSCGFAFCVACKRSWHGPNSSCAITQTKAFMEAHVAMMLPKGDPRRRALEGQYGRKVLRKMAQEYQGEKENQVWLKERTTACPRCETRVEKSEGCNHMTCPRCTTHFCFRCGTKLQTESPYAHFSQPGSCYGRLYDIRLPD